MNNPVPDTVPTVPSLTDHVNVTPVISSAYWSYAVAVNCCVSSTFNSTVDGETVIVVKTGGSASPTVAVPSFTTTPGMYALVSLLSASLLKSSTYTSSAAVLLTVKSTVMNTPATGTGVFPAVRVIP